MGKERFASPKKKLNLKKIWKKNQGFEFNLNFL